MGCDIEVSLLQNVAEIDRVYRSMLSQKENTCGPYNLTCLLRGMGFTAHRGNEIDEDYLASLASTNILIEDEEASESIKRKVKLGILTEEDVHRRFREIVYKFKLPTTSKESELGTSVQGLVDACNRATDGKIAPLPLPSVGRNRQELFTPEKFLRLVKLIFENRDRWSAQALLNYRADRLLNMNSPEYTFFDVLTNFEDEKRFGNDPWPVGHFVTLAGLIRDMKTGHYALLIRDAYKKKGFQGYHIQPFEAVRRALIRGDGREGGILLLVKAEFSGEARRALEGLALVISAWDNGSPYRPNVVQRSSR